MNTNSSTSFLPGVLQWLITLLLPIVLILSSLYIFMSPQYVQWLYSRPEFPPAELFTPDARLYNSLQTLAYTRGEISEQALVALNVYNEREIKHLVDVYNVTSVMFIVVPVSIVVILISLFVLWRKLETRIVAGRALFNGGVLTFVLIVAIGLFAVFAFDSFFVTFHRIFFEGETWIFNYTDSLIQFYPVVFWMTTSYGMALFIALLTILVTAIGGLVIRKYR